MILATYTLWRRDVIRFTRQRSRVVGALGTPVVFWILLGSGLGSSFSVGSLGVPTGGYLEYFYPGTLALIVLFTAIFSTISVIEDRHEGFLQGVMVAPAPRIAIVLGKLLGGTTMALLQAVLFLALAPLANAHVSWSSLPLLAVVLATLAFALTGLGFVLAWMLDSTQGFHAVMNLLLFRCGCSRAPSFADGRRRLDSGCHGHQPDDLRRHGTADHPVERRNERSGHGRRTPISPRPLRTSHPGRE